MERRTVLGSTVGLLVSRVVGAGTPSPTPAVGPGVRIQRLSWAGVKLTFRTTTLFVDATNDPSTAGTPEADVPLTAETPDRYGLVTHFHGDHCDPKALRAVFNERSRLVCDRETALRVGDREVPLLPVELWRPEVLAPLTGDFAVFAVPAADGLGSTQVSWVLDADGRRLFHGGDTGWHGRLWDVGRAYGPFDVAFLPINGFRQSVGRFEEAAVPMSLTPEQAVLAARVLRARTVVPIHYGHAEPGYVEWAGALVAFTAAAKKAGLAVDALAPGASRTIG